MPRKPARLANTYVPLPMKKAESDPRSIQRTDRKNHELRPLCLETSILSQPTEGGDEQQQQQQHQTSYKCLGSSLVELGHTKVLCEVSNINTGIVVDQSLQCQVQFAKHMGKNAILQRLHMVSPLETTVGEAVPIGKLHNAVSQLETDLAHELTIALQPVLLKVLPKCGILVNLTVLQDDGSVLSTCISAATLALMDAQVELMDLVTSCTVAVLVGNSDDEEEEEECIFLADPTQEEILQAQAVIVLAMTPNHKEVTLWRQSGRLTSDMANQAIELCRSGCRTMHKFMREIWVVSSSSSSSSPASVQ